MIRLKKVYLEFPGKTHSLYNILVSNPPKGYQIHPKADPTTRITKSITNIQSIYSFQEVLLNALIPVTLLKSQIESIKKPPKDTDLTYSAGHIILRDEPWVVDLEFITQLSGYSLLHLQRYRKIIENALSSNLCKKIICWTEQGKKSIQHNVHNKKIHEKIEIVRLSTTRKKNPPKHSDDKTRILFVGSSNIPGEFEFKGGIDALRAFKILNKKHKNLELIIRSDIPKKIKNEVKKISNIKIIDYVLPWTQLEKEFLQTDIFLFPSHSTPGLVLLEAMSYGLPVITTDVWANSEMIIDEHNGLLVKPNKHVRYVTETHVPVWNHRPHSKFIQSTRKDDKERIWDIVNQTNRLIIDEGFRKKLGENGRKMVEQGKFSMKKRTEQLKDIFDKATA